MIACSGKQEWLRAGIRVIECETRGFKHQYPIPDDRAVAALYSGEYYNQLKSRYLAGIRHNKVAHIQLWVRAKQTLIDRLRPDLARSVIIGASFLRQTWKKVAKATLGCA